MSTLSLNLVPGYLPTDGELIDNAILRLLARPTITLEGSIGAASIADGAVTTAKLADGALSADTTGRAKMADEYLTAAKLNATQDWSGKTLSGNPTVAWTGTINFNAATFTPPPGFIVQQATAVSTSASTTTANIPLDDTIPQNTEGTELTALQTTITPKSATNLLEIEVEVPTGSNNTASQTHILALFQDSTANARAATFAAVNTLGAPVVLRLIYRMVAGTTSATTFKVRVGVSAGTATINGITGARIFGGVLAARVIIREIQV